MRELNLSNSLNIDSIHGFRRTGKSTRIIDECIQDFFNNGYCIIQDHYLSNQSNIRLIKIIINRLEFEHNLTKENYKIDYNKNKIIKI